MAAKQKTACRIVQKAYGQSLKVFIRTDDSDTGRGMDGLLWSFAQGSFIPHCMTENEHNDWHDFPVQIGVGDLSGETADVLVNLGEAVTEKNFRYPRVIELVCADDQDRQAGRERFRSYKEKGYNPNTHNL